VLASGARVVEKTPEHKEEGQVFPGYLRGIVVLREAFA